METVATWKGKPVQELSKEELIEALEFSANEIQRLHEANQRERDFLFNTFILQKDLPERERIVR